MADLTLPKDAPQAVEYKISELAPPYDTVWAMYYDPDSKVPLYLERAGVRYNFVRADASCATCREWQASVKSVYRFPLGPWGQCRPACSAPMTEVNAHPAHAVRSEEGELQSNEAMKGGAALITRAKFACNRWRDKEEISK